MKTLKDLIESTKCRKGKADGTTKRGAFWLAASIRLRNCGGDGVGINAPDTTYSLQLRHYRSGDVMASVEQHTWHQNDGERDNYQTAAVCVAGAEPTGLLAATTAEDVIVALKAFDAFGAPVYADYKENDVVAELGKFGLPAALPGPDET